MKNAMTKIKGMIYEIRGQKVMFDSDLAVLFEVELRYLNQAVKRNIERFPPDFMFQLTKDEWANLRSQFAISKNEGNNLRSQIVILKNERDNLRSQIVTLKSSRKYTPHVFTEQGIAMLSGLLNSKIAIKVNIQIMRAFVQLRHYVLGQDTNAQIAELRELLLLYIEKNDKRVNDIIIALNNLIAKPVQTKKIGF